MKYKENTLNISNSNFIKRDMNFWNTLYIAEIKPASIFILFCKPFIIYYITLQVFIISCSHTSSNFEVKCTDRAHRWLML